MKETKIILKGILLSENDVLLKKDSETIHADWIIPDYLIQKKKFIGEAYRNKFLKYYKNSYLKKNKFYGFRCLLKNSQANIFFYFISKIENSSNYKDGLKSFNLNKLPKNLDKIDYNILKNLNNNIANDSEITPTFIYSKNIREACQKSLKCFQNNSVLVEKISNDKTIQSGFEIPIITIFISNPTPDNEILKLFDIPIDWAELEFNERISNKKINPGDAYKLWLERWEKFLLSDYFYYTYSERLADQPIRAISTLKDNYTSRSSIQVIWKEKDLYKKGVLVPCTISYQHLIRNNQLITIGNMRSCDGTRLLASDLYFLCKMQKFIAKNLNCIEGPVIMHIGLLQLHNNQLERYIKVFSKLEKLDETNE